jgi:uncharacterized membrane protein YccC
VAREIFTVRLPRPEPPAPDPPGPLGLAVVGVLAGALAYLFSMPSLTGPAFVAGAVATRAARNHRRLQQTLRVATASVFFTYGPVTVATPFPPTWRLVFFATLIGGAIALYEWSAKH